MKLDWEVAIVADDDWPAGLDASRFIAGGRTADEAKRNLIKLAREAERHASGLERRITEELEERAF